MNSNRGASHRDGGRDAALHQLTKHTCTHRMQVSNLIVRASVLRPEGVGNTKPYNLHTDAAVYHGITCTYSWVGQRAGPKHQILQIPLGGEQAKCQYLC